MPYKDLEKRKEASKASASRWSKLHPEQANANARAWRERNPEYMLVDRARRRAKEQGLEFTVTRDTCPPIPEFCPVTGIKLEKRSDGKIGPCMSSPSLDRIDNSKGYTPDNLRVISYQANKWKSNMSIEDVERLLAYMKGEV